MKQKITEKDKYFCLVKIQFSIEEFSRLFISFPFNENSTQSVIKQRYFKSKKTLTKTFNYLQKY